MDQALTNETCRRSKDVPTVEVTVKYLRALRKTVGLQIDPETAEVEWIYAQTLDPYGDYPDLPEECQCVGREYFAREQAIQKPERNRRHHEKIHRDDPVGMIAQKGRRRAMYLATLVCPTSMPSLSSSPWIRGAPHSGLARLMSRINWRISGGTFGRPLRVLDFQRQ
jgi:hypothetical protein